jgi:hypothetical protein
VGLAELEQDPVGLVADPADKAGVDPRQSR